MSEIMKIIDEREMSKNPKKTKTEKNKGGGGTEAMVKKGELIDFVVHLSLVFSN